jgi:hypothetical protein
MPANFCLLPQYADALAERIKTGALNVADLAKLSSEDRRAALADVIGDANAEHVNAAFESKLLLQNQQKGLETWIKQTTKGKPEIQRDLLARVARMDKVLDPKDADGFLADLAKQRLGFGVTMEEAGKIAELAKATSEAKAAMENGGDRMDYGRAKVAFSNYVSDLKNAAPKEKLTVGSAIAKGASLSKSVKASLDNSALFRQGWKTLFSHPDVWAKNSLQSFKDFAQQAGGKAVLDEVNAEIQSRPNALNGNYRKAKLAIGNVEDQFPSSLPEKVPGFGRLFKASEAAYNGFLYRTRADVFDKYVQIAEASGDINEPGQLESIGNLVNSLTGRGHLGKAEGAANVTNALFFSLRSLKSNVDFLTAHQFQGGATDFVREQAAKNLVQTIVGTATVLAVAHAVAPGSVEWNAESSDFGKIKDGNTRFDVTAGMGSLAVLAARLAMLKTKSTTTKIVSPLNSGQFASKTGLDVVHDFFENKLSPAAGIVRDLLKGRTCRARSRPRRVSPSTRRCRSRSRTRSSSRRIRTAPTSSSRCSPTRLASPRTPTAGKRSHEGSPMTLSTTTVRNTTQVPDLRDLFFSKSPTPPISPSTRRRARASSQPSLIRLTTPSRALAMRRADRSR